MNLSCVIVDDEYLAITILEAYAARIPGLRIAATFRKPTEAVSWLADHSTDLLLLDIQMPQLNGFDVLQRLDNRPPVIFTTARHDYAARAFDLDVLDYLVKPIAFERFEKAIHKAIDYHDYQRHRQAAAPMAYTLVRADHRLHKVMFRDILFVEGWGEYIKVHTRNQTLVTLAALKDWETLLPAHDFVRIHKSYIIALTAVSDFGHDSVTIQSQTLPIGRAYKSMALQKLQLRF